MSAMSPLQQQPAGSRRPPAGAAGAHPAGPAGTRPSSRTDTPRPLTHRLTAMAAGFVALFLEVEAGVRPRSHVAPLLAPMVYARLSGVWIRRGTPGRVLTVRIVAATPPGFDAVAIVRRGARCGAIALHFTRSRRGWLVDDVALPEHGPLPLPPYPVPADETDDDTEAALVPSAVRPTPAPAPQAEPQPVASVDWFTASDRG